MKISIITVCLNSEKTIEQTIKSVLEQQYKDLEYIIVDGGSTDGTMDIVKKYDITKVISEPDNGLYDAMNKGIAMATGDVIGIINSDDWYEPDAFQVVAQKFSNNDVDILYGTTNGILIDKVVEVREPQELWTMHYQMPFVHASVFVRKEIYDRYGVFDTTYRIAADCDIFLRWYTNSLRMKDAECTIANFSLDGLSAQQSGVGFEECFQIRKKYLEFASTEKKKEIQDILDNQKVSHSFSLRLFDEKDNMNTLIDVVKNEKIVIYGAGKWGKQAQAKMEKSGVITHFFVDNNSEKWGTFLNGVEIKSPADLQTFSGIVLVFVSKNTEEIMEQIIKLNNHNLKCITWKEL